MIVVPFIFPENVPMIHLISAEEKSAYWGGREYSRRRGFSLPLTEIIVLPMRSKRLPVPSQEKTILDSVKIIQEMHICIFSNLWGQERRLGVLLKM